VQRFALSTAKGWRIIEKYFDFDAQGFYCLVAVNKTTIFAISKNPDMANATFFFDFESLTLTPGPQLTTRRQWLTCSRIQNPQTGAVNVIIGGKIFVYKKCFLIS